MTLRGVLKEEPKYNKYVDITETVRSIKVHVESGYYEDSWMDEHGELTVMSGEKGMIDLEFMFPGILEGGETITITKDDGTPERIPLQASVVHHQIQAEPWQLVDLKFDYNFYMQGTDDQRSEYRLATLVHINVE